MKITRLQLVNFRNYDSCDIAPFDGTNLLYGKNGSGKTNVVESIYMCAIGRSFRESQDSCMVRQGTASSRIICQTRDENGGSHRIILGFTNDRSRRKFLQIDGKNAENLGAIMGVLRCVLFSPDNISLISGGPEIRRKFLDTLICQISPTYMKSLQEYNKLLRQRSEIFHRIRDMEHRQSLNESEEMQLDCYDKLLCEKAEVIFDRRQRTIREMNRQAAEMYGSISQSREEKLSLEYQSCGVEKLQGSLKEARQRDLMRCTTSVGLHRDEVLFSLSGMPMRQFGSQGQSRTAALAVKLAQIMFIRNKTGENPVLLLDDVMSELDIIRRSRLIGQLSQMGALQSFITCTDLRDVDGYGDSGLISSMQTYLVTSSAGSANIKLMTEVNKQSAKQHGTFELDNEL